MIVSLIAIVYEETFMQIHRPAAHRSNRHSRFGSSDAGKDCSPGAASERIRGDPAF
jgi:hypothetical protein